MSDTASEVALESIYAESDASHGIEGDDSEEGSPEGSDSYLGIFLRLLCKPPPPIRHQCLVGGRRADRPRGVL